MSHSGKPERVVFEVHPHIIGGTEHFICNLLTCLDRNLFEPIVISYEPGQSQSLFESRGISTETKTYVSATGEPTELIEFLRSSGAALVQSSYFSPVLALASARAGIPHVWRLGGHIDVVHEGKSRREKKIFLALVSCLSLKMICGSHFLRRQFSGVNGQDIAVIYNGVNLEEFRSQAWHYDESSPKVGMVAHLVPQKRHEDFIRAAHMASKVLPQVRFYIFGAPYNTAESLRYGESLRRIVAELGFGDRFSFLRTDKNRYESLKEMDVFVLPSVNEGASNSVVEAMALGKPVIAARSGANPELVDHGKTGVLVPAASPERLASEMLSLLKNPERARLLGLAGRKKVEEKFDIRHCARKYESLYKNLLRPADC